MKHLGKKEWFYSLMLMAFLSPFIHLMALQIQKSDSSSMDLFGRGQLLGHGEIVDDPYRDNARVYLFLQQARFGASGHIDDYRYHLELALGGEEPLTGNVSLSMLDLRFDVPLFEGTYIRAGQYKVPYGRESLTNDGKLLFTDRSIQNLGFMLGRDTGLSLVTKKGLFSSALSIFTGGARDTPERYIPEKLGMPLTVLRIGLDSTSEDAVENQQADIWTLSETEGAFYLNAAYTKDTLIGHSTALGVRPIDRPFALMPGWNRYLKQAPLDRSSYYQLGADGIIRSPMGDYVTSLEGQVDMARFNNNYGQLRYWGARLQASAAKKPFEFALRTAVIKPDSRFSNGLDQVTGSKPFYEISPSFSYYHREWSKFVFQASALIDTPVAREHTPKTGIYVLTEQTTDVAPTMKDGNNRKGAFERQFVSVFQLMWQASF